MHFNTKILSLGKLPDNVENKFKHNFSNFKSYSLDESTNNLHAIIQENYDTEILISFLCHQINKNIIDSLKYLKIIANYAVGFDNIDLNSSKNKKIFVLNTPDVLSNATADLALALLMSVSRKIIDAHHFVINKKWQGLTMNMFMGQNLSNKNFGIIGLGRIGKIFAKRINGFDPKIMYTNSTNKSDKLFDNSFNARCVNLNELLTKSDIISIHCPLNESTHHLLNKSNLKLIKPNCILINTARGSIIDQTALIEILESNKIRGLGLDVFENEPNIPDKLLEHPNVVLTPHIGSADTETRDSMGYLLYDGICNLLQDKLPHNLVL